MTAFMIMLIVTCSICAVYACANRGINILGIFLSVIGYCFCFFSSLWYLLFFIPIAFWFCKCSKDYKEEKRREKETPEQCYLRIYNSLIKSYEHNIPLSAESINFRKKKVLKAFNNYKLNEEDAIKLMMLVIGLEYQNITLLTHTETEKLARKEFETSPRKLIEKE